jgi:large subunit ribosomal protein L6
MSRIGKKPVAIPGGVTAEINNGSLSVKGPKGTLTIGLSDLVTYKLEDGCPQPLGPAAYAGGQPG